MTPNQQIKRINNIMQELDVHAQVRKNTGEQTIIKFYMVWAEHYMEVRFGGYQKGISCHHYRKGHEVAIDATNVKQFNRIYLHVVEMFADGSLQLVPEGEGNALQEISDGTAL